MKLKQLYLSFYNIKNDKLLHFIAGMLLTLIFHKAFCLLNLYDLLSRLVSFLLVFLVAAVKELFDYKHGGLYSCPDMWATVLGSVPVILLV